MENSACEDVHHDFYLRICPPVHVWAESEGKRKAEAADKRLHEKGAECLCRLHDSVCNHLPVCARSKRHKGLSGSGAVNADRAQFLYQ